MEAALATGLIPETNRLVIGLILLKRKKRLDSAIYFAVWRFFFSSTESARARKRPTRLKTGPARPSGPIHLCRRWLETDIELFDDVVPIAMERPLKRANGLSEA